MNLETLTAALESVPNSATVLFQAPADYYDGTVHPGRLTSWRGSYDELTLTPGTTPITAGKLLADARKADGGTFVGWKGGDYRMGPRTPVWADDAGDYQSWALTGSHVFTTINGVVLYLEVSNIGEYR